MAVRSFVGRKARMGEALPAMLLVTHFKMRAKYSQNRLALFMERFGDWLGRINASLETQNQQSLLHFPLSARSICHFLARHNYGKVIIHSVDIQHGSRTKSKGCGNLAKHRYPWFMKTNQMVQLVAQHQSSYLVENISQPCNVN